MRTQFHKTTLVGELVVAAFDKAAQYTTDPEEVARLATRAVTHMLRSARRTRTSTPPSPLIARAEASAPTDGDSS